MALQYSPKIVQDGLVMCLDSSQNKSYPTTDLPVKNGLVMWMDAADDTTFSYSSDTTVSQWRDKSGFNYHMIPVTTGPTRNAFLNSRKVLAFTTSQNIASLPFTVETSAYTVFVVSRLTGTTNARVLTAYYNNWLLGHWGGLVNPYYAEGWVYYPPNAADTVWRMYMGDWGGPSNDLAAAYSNGTVLNNGSTVASAGPKGLGINISGTEQSTCEAAEIIVFNRVLTTAERRLIHTYLGQKWGISNTDRSIIDLSNNNIASFGGAAGSQTVANMPTFDFYNKGTLKFDGLNDYSILTSNLFSSFSTFTISIWAYLKTLTTKGMLFKSSKDSANQIIFEIENSQLHWAVRSSNTWSPDGYSSAVVVANVWQNFVVTVDSSGWKLYINGSQNGGSTQTSNFTSIGTTQNYYIGYSPDGFYGDGRPLDGNIGNVLIYNKALSATEVSQNYESQKSKFANTIVQQGLVLNLDAGNPYSYAGAGSTWYDVSGNTKHFIIDGSGITYNSGGYFTLADGGITRSATITNSTTCTVVVWIRTTDTQSLIFRGNNDNGYYLAAYNPNQGFYNALCGSPTYWIDTISVANPNPTYLDGNWHMWEMKNVNFSSWTNYEFNKYGSYTFGNGAVGQIMIYDRNLSSGESLQIYNATKGRFGL